MSGAEERSTFEMIVDAHDDTEPEPHRHLLEQANNQLAALIAAVRDTGKSGSVTIRIKASPDGTGRVAFAPAVEAKIPNPPMSSVALWVKGNGKLSRVNPNQKTLEFQGPKSVRKTEEN